MFKNRLNLQLEPGPLFQLGDTPVIIALSPKFTTHIREIHV